MASITKTMHRKLSDNESGTVLLEEERGYSFKIEKEETWCKMFIQAMSKAIGVSGDENTVLIRLIQDMDKDNMIDLSSRRKQDIIIYDIYAAKNPEIDVEDKEVRAKASRRFSQVVKKLIDRKLVAKKNSSTYMVDSDYIEFTYPDSLDKNKKRQRFLSYHAELDRDSGKVKVGFSGNEQSNNNGGKEFGADEL